MHINYFWGKMKEMITIIYTIAKYMRNLHKQKTIQPLKSHNVEYSIKSPTN